MKTSALLITLLSVINLPTALAEEGKHRGKMLRALDTDGDKALSFEEFQNGPNQRFKNADVNSDGLLTLDEMKQQHEARTTAREAERQARASERLEEIGEHFTELDTDDSGDITTEEAQRGMFNRLDRDGDGFISKHEAKKARRHMKNRHDRDGRKKSDQG
ncbi:MAG: Ca2+-binding EF-hand superfamily protein [Candidatus Azotimanducaceae bacterium]|jgi:Ca2+-binding EF-hand superfamily protein